MKKFSDQELIQELQNRFVEHKYALQEQKKLMKRLQAVNAKLEKSETLKSNFISNIRNEINNPFASILGISSNILQVCKKGNKDCLTKVVSMATLIHNEAFKLDFQLKNIFAAASIEAGEALPEIAKVEINELVNEAVNYFKMKVQQKEIMIQLENHLTTTDDFYFKTDPGKLELALMNLINNALEFSIPKSQVIIRTTSSNGCLLIDVIDQGPGISQEDQQVIFDRFNQLDTGLTREHSGHGLGLSVTKALLELINGTIQLSSQKGKGSRFTIELEEWNLDQDVDDVAFGGNELFFDAEEKF